MIHETAIVEDRAEIGEGTKIWHWAHIMREARIGKNCVIGQGCYVGSEAVIGNGVKIQNNVSVYDLVTLDDNVFVGPSVVFTNVLKPRAEIRRDFNEYLPTIVKEGATIGANATIVCGVVIGKYAFVGAGTVVTNDIPDYALVMGNPATVRGWVCECSWKLNLSGIWPGFVRCPKCQKRYRLHLNKVVKLAEEEKM